MTTIVRRKGWVGSDSPGAPPTLTGLSGSMIAVLDYCLTDPTYGAGWTKAYSGTNVAAYRQPAGSNQFYLFVDDTQGREIRMKGFEVVTGISGGAPSGTGQFPTEVQFSGGLRQHKSSVADSSGRGWLFISNGKCFYMMCNYSTTAGGVEGFFFGDILSYKATDAYNTVLVGSTQQYSGGSSGGISRISQGANTAEYQTYALTFIARPYTQVGSSVPGGHFTDYVRAYNAVDLGSGGVSYPDPVSGGLLMAPVWVSEYGWVQRGVMPGIWGPLHTKPLTHGDTFSGTGILAGKTFEAVQFYTGNQMAFFETSDTWPTTV